MDYRNSWDGNRARFSPDGSQVIVGGLDGKVFLWNVNTNQTTVLPIDGYVPATHHHPPSTIHHPPSIT
jgi:WD40 repeat protein